MQEHFTHLVINVKVRHGVGQTDKVENLTIRVRLPACTAWSWASRGAHGPVGASLCTVSSSRLALGKVFLDGATRSRPPRAPLISYTAAVAVANASPALLSSLVLLSAFFQPARRLGSCLYRSAFSHLPLLLHLRHLTPAPASGTANASRLLCHGLVVRPIIIRLVLLLGSAFLTFRISLAPCWLRRRRHQHEQQCHCATFTGPCAIGSSYYLTLVNCIYWRSCLSGGGGRLRTLQTMSPLQTTPVRLEEATT